LGKNAPVRSRIFSASAIAAIMRIAGSVSTNVAPYASSVRLRSSLICAGSVRISL
jgi:hypothetical protein